MEVVCAPFLPSRPAVVESVCPLPKPWDKVPREFAASFA